MIGKEKPTPVEIIPPTAAIACIFIRSCEENDPSFNFENIPDAAVQRRIIVGAIQGPKMVAIET